MALAGYDSPQLVINSTSTTTSYSGTVTGVTSGNLYVVTVEGCGNSGTNDPSGWTVTLGSDTLTYQNGQGADGVFGFSAIFTGVATGSGDLTLSITTTVSCRSLAAHCFDVTGFDATTPVANSGQNNSHNSNTTSLTAPNAFTTSADGNVIIGCVSVKGGDITGLAVGTADGSTTGQTGGNSTNDNEWGVAWQRTPTAAAVTFDWTWTGADRPGAAWIELAEATGGGTNVSATKATLQVTANQADVANDVNVAGAVASLTIAPHAAAISTVANTDVSASSAALQIATNSAAISFDVDIGASVASLQLAPNAATISTTSNVNVDASLAAIQLSPQPTTVSLDVDVSVDSSALRITCPPASVGYGVNIFALPSSLEIDAKTASVIFNVGVAANAANLQFSPHMATISDGGLSSRRSASPGGSATGGDFTRNVANGTIARSIRGGSIQ